MKGGNHRIKGDQFTFPKLCLKQSCLINVYFVLFFETQFALDRKGRLPLS